MAERRMFAKTIIDSDAFLEMPLSAQALYFHLSMRADDDGFLNNAKKIQKTINASEDDLKILLLKRFIIAFDDGIIVIKHWRMNNYLRNDRHKPTVYQEELSMLEVKENGAYSLKIDDENMVGIPNDNQMTTQYRLDKNSIEENSIDKYSNKPPLSPLEGETKEKTSKTDYIKMIKDRQFDKSLEDVIVEWYHYKTEKRQAYKPTGFSKFLTEVQNNVINHGVDAVINVVNVSMANNWQGIAWDKLKKNNAQQKQSSSDVLSKYLKGGK